MKLRKLVTLALLTALSLVLFVVESQIPAPVPVPGVKLGLGNVIVTAALFLEGPWAALAVLAGKLLLSGLLTGNLGALAYSAAGGLLSWAGMGLLRPLLQRRQLWVASVLGAMLHNLGQLLTALWITATPGLLAYLPVLLLSGMATGLFTGLAAQALVADGVDAVFTPSDNTIMNAELSIYELFSEAGIPHYAGADSFALNGAFLGYGVDYANLGVETANMIAQILLEGKNPAELPAMTFDNGTATVNTEICQALGLDYDTVAELFAPYCTQVQPITTAESFDDLT